VWGRDKPWFGNREGHTRRTWGTQAYYHQNDTGGTQTSYH